MSARAYDARDPVEEQGLFRPEPHGQRVVVIIPAFNEETVISDVVSGILPLADRVVVVDDGSTDRTAEVAASAGAAVIRHALNRGQGASLQTGIAWALRAGAELIVTFDADGQHQPSDVVDLLRPLQEGRAEVTLGSRFLRPSAVPASRRLLLRVATLFTRLVSGLKVSDTHNGLRAFTRDAATRIQIHQDRMAHASEILDEIRMLGLSFVEVPVSIHYSEYSRQKGQSGFGALRVLWDYVIGRWSR